MSKTKYIGRELELFDRAENWKKYLATFLQPYIEGDVLEVGAGIGANTRVLCSGRHRGWVCLEPDRRLADRILQRAKRNYFEIVPEVIIGNINTLKKSQKFDSILYIDVLEHIHDDTRELEDATYHLRPNGTLVVLAPAHQFLYSHFDEAIGHYRRYSKLQLCKIQPVGLKQEKIFYVDSVGLLVSIANRLILKSGSPTTTQIMIWDKLCVRLSKMFDVLTSYRVGKSLIAVWRKTS